MSDFAPVKAYFGQIKIGGYAQVAINASTWADESYPLYFAFDADAGPLIMEELGLMLSEGGGLGYNTALSSPFGGKLSQGDYKEADLAAWTVRTQNDWRGGLGQEYAYAATNRYDEGLIDTRFMNMAILPPRATPTQPTSVSPSLEPSESGVVVGTQTVSASRGGQVTDIPQFKPDLTGVDQGQDVVKAEWQTGANVQFGPDQGGIQGTQALYAKWDVSADPSFETIPTYVADTQWGDVGIVAMSFTPTADVVVTQVKVRLRTVFNQYGSGARFSLRSDLNNEPYADLTVKNFALPAASPTTFAWVTITLDSAIKLTANTPYWIVMGKLTGGTDVRWSGDFGHADIGKTMTMSDGVTWVATAQPSIRHFVVNSGPVYSNKQEKRLAQSFKAPAAGIVAKRLRFWAGATKWTGTPGLSMTLCSDSSGSPGSVLYTAALAQADFNAASAYWVIKDIGAVTLTGNATYWIVITPTSSAGAHQVEIAWACDDAGSYGDGNAKAYVSSWTAISGTDLYFSVDNLAPQKTRQAQSFVAPAAGITLTKVQLYVRRQGTAIAGGTLKIETDSSTAPSGTAVVTRALTQAEVQAIPEQATMWTFTVASTVLTASTTYWITLEMDTGGVASGTYVYWYNDRNALYTAGSAAVAEYNTATSVWGAWALWDIPERDFFFILNDGPYTTSGPLIKARAAMSFATGGAITLTKVAILLKQVNKTGAPTLTVSVQSDTAGSPSGTVVGALTWPVTLTALSSTDQAWLVLTGSQALNGTYWIVAEANAPAQGDALSVSWYGDTAAGYSGGSAKSDAYGNNAWAGWSAIATDLFFVVNQGKGFSAAIAVNPVEFSNGWYVASGAGVYKWNTATSRWDLAATLGGTITGLCSYGGKLYAALGDSLVMQQSANGTTWTAVTGHTGTYVAKWSGYLYLANAAAATLDYFNGTTWGGTAIQVGLSDAPITGIAGYKTAVIVAKTTGLYELAGTMASQFAMYLPGSDNGKNLGMWIGDGQLYVSVRNSLQAWNGVALVSTGPDKDEGMPAGEQGRVSAMVGTASWLFAAIDAGASGRSAIYAYNSVGWHCLVKASQIGRRIQALGYEAITSAAGTPRLWFAEGGNVYYIELPDVTDNPWHWTGSTYQNEGMLETSWLGGELAQIPKDFQSIFVRSDGCSVNQAIDVFIQVDRTNQWWPVGTVTRSPQQELELRAPAMTNKTCDDGCTDQVIVVTSSSSLLDLNAGQFVRINAEVGQVQSVDSASQFTLALPLKNGAPIAGEVIYSSRPAGYEIKRRYVFRTTDATATPRMISESVKYQEQIVSRIQYTLTIRIEDHMTARNGAAYPHEAQTLVEALEDWAVRVTPYYLVLPDGRLKRVKCTGLSGGSLVRQENSSKNLSFKSSRSMTFIVV